MSNAIKNDQKIEGETVTILFGFSCFVNIPIWKDNVKIRDFIG